MTGMEQRPFIPVRIARPSQIRARARTICPATLEARVKRAGNIVVERVVVIDDRRKSSLSCSNG